MAITAMLHHTGLYPLEAFKEAARLRAAYAEENLDAIEAGVRLVFPE